MQQIRKLNESEMHDIYTRLFPEAFPKDEIRSWRSIRRQLQACLLYTSIYLPPYSMPRLRASAGPSACICARPGGCFGGLSPCLRRHTYYTIFCGRMHAGGGPQRLFGWPSHPFHAFFANCSGFYQTLFTFFL